MTTRPKKLPSAKSVSLTRKSLPAKRPVKSKIQGPKKSKRNFKSTFTIIAAIFLIIITSPFYSRYVIHAFASGWHWLNDIGEDINYRHYKSLNIHVSEKYYIHGIDVSYAQGKIDWPKVKAMDENGLHISFVFIKATEGENFVDKYYQRNWREAAKTGLFCGAYHYFRPAKSGITQANLFLKTVRLEPNDLPAVVDIEELGGVSPEQMRSSLNEFIHVVRRKTKSKPIIYVGLNFYQSYLKGYFNEYPIWIAHYDKPESTINRAVNWLFWQHSSRATVNGIYHAVDFDTFKGDSIAFKQLLMP